MQKIFCGSKNYCGGIMKLVELLPNQTAKVVKLDIPDVRIKRRICDLGIFEIVYAQKGGFGVSKKLCAVFEVQHSKICRGANWITQFCWLEMPILAKRPFSMQ